MPTLGDAAEPDEVVGSEISMHPGIDFRQSHPWQLVQIADGLDLAKALFDTFARLQADGVILAACPSMLLRRPLAVIRAICALIPRCFFVALVGNPRGRLASTRAKAQSHSPLPVA
jgi:hypothetical protein